jgi:hypothetical protein
MFIPLEYFQYFVVGVSGTGFLLGVLSAFWPRRSVGLYVWIMARFNWSVRPLDEDREIRNTACFGYVLMILPLVTIAVFLAKMSR